MTIRWMITGMESEYGRKEGRRYRDIGVEKRGLGNCFNAKRKED
jgi:hypothetical protein